MHSVVYDPEVVERLRALDARLFPGRIKNFLAIHDLPFDIDRPNIHESKKDFLAELAAVEAAMMHCDGLLALHRGADDKDEAAHDALISRLVSAIERNAQGDLNAMPIEAAHELARKNVVETGFYYNSLLLIITLRNAYGQRYVELKDQEKQFWSIAHRPPNYYARTIALRFARMYARERRAKPTFGTSSEGNHPSTEYGRALEEIFDILGIKAHVRNAGEWAIGQLSEQDWTPPDSRALGGLFGFVPENDLNKPRHSDVVNALLRTTVGKGQ